MKPTQAIAAAVAALIILFILAFIFLIPSVEQDLQRKADSTLAAEGIAVDSLSFSGQQAELHGKVSSEQERQRIENIVSAIPGISAVDNRLKISTPMAVVLKASGAVTITGTSGQTIAAETGTRLDPGDKIETAEDGRVELRFLDDNSVLRMRPKSLCVIRAVKEKNSVAKNILVEVGSVLSRITDQNSVFRVTTTTSVAAVKGTRFWTVQKQAGPTTFLGEEGLVEVRNDAGVIELKAGYACTVVSKNSVLRVEKIDLQKAWDAKVGKRRIGFPQSGFDISEAHRQLLDKIVLYINEYPTARLEIKGYSDALGDSLENQRLSAERAESVKTYLVENGADPEVLFVAGLGEQDPVATNATAYGRAKNRRVEFHVREDK